MSSPGLQSDLQLLVPIQSLLDPVPAPVEYLDSLALEWQSLLALVAGYAVSRVGRESINSLVPSTDQAWIEHQHQLVNELRSLLDSAATIRSAAFSIPPS